jgi:Na+-translocating ferredoxin:NAD+ oxidoreductase RnfG subunit
MARMRTRWPVSWSLLGPAVVLSAPAPSFAVDYLTVEQAQKVLLDQADAVEVRDYQLDPAQLRELRGRLGAFQRERWQLRLARRGGRLAGVMVVDDVIGKFERITYATAIGADGAITGIEILSYRESHGFEVRLPVWRRQFIGKDGGAPLRVGEDISNISGATLSCQHVTEGVRRIVAVVDVLRRAGALQ